MTEQHSAPSAGDLHRLLDEAFIDVAMTPDAQDLKEEMRANLLARVAELEAAGRPPGEAVHRAIAELGDVRELVSGTATPAGPGRPDASSTPPALPRSTSATAAAAMERNRVRPKPAFVMRVVVASTVAVIALTLVTLAVTEVLTIAIGAVIGLLALGASAIGWIVGDSLSQETTTNHPMPTPRAGGYYLASSLGLFGLGMAGLVAPAVVPVWTVVFAASAIVASIVLFAFLGATQTNRRKSWLLALQHDERHRVGTRFEEEPETAARFGIYTVVIWLLSFATFVVLGFTVSWIWSWLALLGGFVAMMLTLARMLFGPRKA